MLHKLYHPEGRFIEKKTQEKYDLIDMDAKKFDIPKDENLYYSIWFIGDRHATIDDKITIINCNR